MNTSLFSEDSYRLFFENALSAMAFHEIIVSAEGKPIDYVFLEVNPAFEEMTGLKANDICGKTVRQVLPGIENDPANWIGKFGRVALSGEKLIFEQFAERFGKWFRIVAFQTIPGQFCTFFEDITGEKHMEEELPRTAANLEKRTHELEAILSSVQDYMYILNPDGEFVFANQRLLDLWGLNLDQVVGKNFAQLDYPPEVESVFMDAIREVIATGQVVKNVTEYCSANGQSGCHENFLAPMPGSDGHIAFVVGSSRDITERIVMEERLRKKRELLQTIYDTIPVMLTIWDPSLQVLQLNKAIERITGWKEEDLLEKSIMELTYPDPGYRRWVGDYMNSLEPGFRDIRMVTKSGDVLETSWANIPISDGRNIGIGIDVTERKNYEELLSNLYDRLQTVVDHVADGVMVFDPEGKALERNIAAEKILEQLTANNLMLDNNEYRLFDQQENEVPEEQWPVSRALRGEPVIKNVYRTVHKHSEKELYLEYSAIPVFDKRRLRMVIVTLHDLTERRKAHNAVLRVNETLNQKNCELEKMKQLHENLLYIIAHDLKGPINNMKMAVEMLQKVPDMKMKEELFLSLDGLINQQDKILKGLMEVIEVQSTEDLKYSDILLEGVVAEIASYRGTALSDCNGNISCSFEEVPVIRYNPTFIRSIFDNLISNAIKYADESRDLHIEIHSRREDDHVMIAVRDNGTGIDLEKYHDQLFRPFQRFTEKSEGTGVGLFILRNLVEKNGGKVEVESAPGEGTSFYCYLKEYGNEA